MTNCVRCGEPITQIDITQKDANGDAWHCWCADICLAEWKEQRKYIDELRHKIEVQIAVNCELADEVKRIEQTK